MASKVYIWTLKDTGFFKSLHQFLHTPFFFLFPQGHFLFCSGELFGLSYLNLFQLKTVLREQYSYVCFWYILGPWLSRRLGHISDNSQFWVAVTVQPCSTEFSGLNPCISASKYTRYSNTSKALNWHIVACVCSGGWMTQAENAKAGNAESLNYFRCGREIKFPN